MGVVSSVLAGAARAGASEGLEVVRRAGAEACPPTAEMRARIVERLGRDPFTGDAPLALEVEFAREDEAFVARVRSATGERELRSTAPTCGSLADSVALAAALLARGEEAPPAPPAPPPPPPPPREAETAPREGSAGLDVPPRSAIFAGAAVMVGVLPQVAPAPMLAVRVRFAPRLLASGAIFYAPQQHTDDGALGFSLAAAEAGACWEALAAGRVSAGPCAHLVAGDLSIASLLPLVASPGDRLFLGGAAGARAAFRIAGPWSIDVGTDALVPFGRWRATTTCNTVSYDPPRVDFFASAGVGLSFL